MQSNSNKTHRVPHFSFHCFVQGHRWGGPRPASDQNSRDKEESTERRLMWRKDGEKQMLPRIYSLLKRSPEKRKVCTRLSEKKQWKPERSKRVMELTLPMHSQFTLLFHIFSKETLDRFVGDQAGWHHPHFVLWDTENLMICPKSPML